MRSLFSRLLVLPFTVVLVAACGGSDVAGDTPSDGATDDTGTSGETSAADTLGSDTAATDTANSDTTATDTAGSDTTATDTAGGDTTATDVATDTKSGDALASDSDAGSADTADVAARRGPAPVVLGLAGNYVMLGQSEVRTVSTSIVTGDVGISPATSTAIVGFSLTRAGTYWTSAMVTGKLYSVDNDTPTPSLLTTAITNMGAAYTDAATRPTPDSLNYLGGAIGGTTLTPGLYRWTSSVGFDADVTLSGGANDTWIFQITGDLTSDSARHIKLSGGAKAKNVVWQVAGLVALGTTSHFEGVILCKTGITLKTGASINGRLLAQTAVIIDSSTVAQPTP